MEWEASFLLLLFFGWCYLSPSPTHLPLFTSVVRFHHCVPRAKPVLLSCGPGSKHRRCFQPPFYQERCFKPLQTLNLALIPCLFEALFIPLFYKTHKHLPAGPVTPCIPTLLNLCPVSMTPAISFWFSFLKILLFLKMLFLSV